LRRDLHDGLGPSLAAAALSVETARALLQEDQTAAATMLDRVLPRLRAAVDDVRTVVHDLRPPALDELGLAGATEELATRFSGPSLTVAVSAGVLGDLPAAVDVAAYRIVAEALANVAKHAGASAVQVRLHRGQERLDVLVEDNGLGFPTQARSGVGLTSMRERAEEIGGSLVVEPTARGGTVVRASFPVATA
jgi:two-component system NarL family sensor kinase